MCVQHSSAEKADNEEENKHDEANKDNVDPSSNASPHRTPDKSKQGEQSEPTPPRSSDRLLSPRRISPRMVLKAGSRIWARRKDEGGCGRATVVAIRENGGSVVVHDDLMWVGFRTEDLINALRKGTFSHLVEAEDVHPQQRVAFMMNPKPGQPPDSFLIGEFPLHVQHWRLFLEIKPAPPNGTFGQRYSPPRIAKSISSGMKVTLSGRATSVVRMEKNKAPEAISTSTQATFLGVLDAVRPSQHSFWALVSIGEKPELYVASLFGKLDEHAGEVHVHPVEEPPVSMEALMSLLDSAKVSSSLLIHAPHNVQCETCDRWVTQVALKDRTPSQVNAALARKPVPQSSNPAANNEADRPTNKQNQSRGGGNKGKSNKKASGGVDPYVDNIDLAGVGRGALQKLSVETLMVMASTRDISGADDLDKPRLIARLEAWKRERSLRNRKGGNTPPSSDSSDDDSPKPDDKNDNKPVDKERPRPELDRRGPRGGGQPTPNTNLGKDPTELIDLDKVTSNVEVEKEVLQNILLQQKLHEQQKLAEAQQSMILQMQHALRNVKSATVELSTTEAMQAAAAETGIVLPPTPPRRLLPKRQQEAALELPTGICASAKCRNC